MRWPPSGATSCHRQRSRAAIPDAVEQAKKPTYRRTRRFGRARGQDGWFNIDRVMSLKFRGDTEPKGGSGSGLAIRGVKDDLPVHFEPGGAVPGDRIVGVMIPGEGIRIFQIHSPRLREYEHEGWIDVDLGRRYRYAPAFSGTHQCHSPQRAGNFGADSQSYRGGRWQHRQRAGWSAGRSDFTEMRIELEVLDLVHLNHIIAGLREKAVVNKVERVFD